MGSAKICRNQIWKGEINEHEVLVLRETNQILSDILQKRMPDKEVVIKKDGKVISKIPE